MKNRPGADNDGGETAPDDRPSPTLLGLRVPTVNNSIIFCRDGSNENEKQDEPNGLTHGK